MTATLFLGQHVDLGVELGVGRDTARLGQHHSALDVVLVDSAEEETHVVTSLAVVQELPEGMEMVMPGDNVQMTIELITPIAMDEGLRFAIREGGRTVGAGVVTKILK